MKRCILLLLAAGWLCLPLRAQSGTPGDPFTALIQARTVSTPGVHHFSIAGVSFSTFVDDEGYVLAAIDFGNGIGNLPQGTALTSATRGILNPTVLAVLTETSEVRISHSGGAVDANTQNATVIERVRTNTTLMTRQEDNPFHNDWKGTGKELLNADANDAGVPVGALHTEVFHTRGNAGGMHWRPVDSQQELMYGTEHSIADAESLMLWVRANTGSSSNPYTSLAEAVQETTPGIRYFRIGGLDFSTYVEGGYVQVARDFGDGIGDLPQGTALGTTARGILSPAVLSQLVEADEIRISSSVGDLDVTTTNATVVERVRNNQTLMNRSPDNAFNNDWSGTGENHLKAGATSDGRLDNVLQNEIFHTDGNANGLHWYPNRGDQALTFNNDIAAAESFTLWARATAASLALPLALQQFRAERRGSSVLIAWSVEQANGGEAIDLQRSFDGQWWSDVHHVSLDTHRGAARYDFLDSDPATGPRYYRLRQTDADGTVDFSHVLSVASGAAISPASAYPNPVGDFLTLEGVGDGDPEVYTSAGARLVPQPRVLSRAKDRAVLDLSGLPPGAYFVRLPAGLLRVMKR